MSSAPGTAKRGLRRFFGAKKGPLPDETTREGPSRAAALVSMIKQAQAAPFDPMLTYDVGIALLRHGIEEDAVRHLERAFRLDPLNIVRFVQTPGLKELRLLPKVVALLTRLRRDAEQRSYAAYA